MVFVRQPMFPYLQDSEVVLMYDQEILLYHGVDEDPSKVAELEITPDRLSRMLLKLLNRMLAVVIVGATKDKLTKKLRSF